MKCSGLPSSVELADLTVMVTTSTEKQQIAKIQVFLMSDVQSELHIGLLVALQLLF